MSLLKNPDGKLTASGGRLLATSITPAPCCACPPFGSDYQKPPACAACLQPGLTVEYFNNTTGSLPIVVTKQTSTEIDFTWAGSPETGVNADGWSAHYTGAIYSDVAGSYTLSLTSAGGVQLYFNSALRIDNLTAHSETTNTTASITLIANRNCDLMIVYRDNVGAGSTGRLKLEWTPPSQPTALVPAARLNSGVGQVAQTSRLRRQAYTNMDLSGTVSRTTQIVSGSLTGNIPAGDNISVRWTGYLQAPQTGDFTFYMTTAGGARVWVDDELLLDNWASHESTEDTSVVVALEALAWYPITIEYFHDTGTKQMLLQWSYVYNSGANTVPKENIPAANLSIGRDFPTARRYSFSFSGVQIQTGCVATAGGTSVNLSGSLTGEVIVEQDLAFPCVWEGTSADGIGISVRYTASTTCTGASSAVVGIQLVMTRSFSSGLGSLGLVGTVLFAAGGGAEIFRAAMNMLPDCTSLVLVVPNQTTTWSSVNFGKNGTATGTPLDDDEEI